MKLYKLSGICILCVLTLLTFSIGSLMVHVSNGQNNVYTKECSAQQELGQEELGQEELGQEEFGQLPVTLTRMEYSSIQSNDTKHMISSVSVYTDKVKYVPGDIVGILGQVWDQDGRDCDATVIITVKLEGSNTPPFKTSAHTDFGYYYNYDLAVAQAGTYQIEVSIEGTTAKAQNFFNVTNFFLTTPAYMMYIGAAFLAGLMLVIAKGATLSPSVSEILRFLFITGLILAPIGSLVLTDIEIGTDSPVGLVKRPPLDENGQPKCKDQAAISDSTLAEGGEWVINIGGRNGNCYAEGIQIPINVAIFGMVGGYLRYLWKTAGLRLTKEKETRSETQGEEVDKTRTWLFYQSLEDLALLFLSPLLAIAVWFVLYQGGTTGAYGIAVISFTVGLITEEVIQSLIRFSRSLLKTADSTQRTRAQGELPTGGTGQGQQRTGAVKEDESQEMKDETGQLENIEHEEDKQERQK